MNSNRKYDNNRRNYVNGPTNGHGGGKNKRMNRGVAMEGVYGNSRFAYSVTSLVGCSVRVEVKNGSQYEGVFQTFSPSMEIVLQMAHCLEDKQDGPHHKDGLIDAIIFKAQDVVSVVATNVDLDYATKDSFTDSAISKFNGEIIHTRELQKWDGDGPGIELSLESDLNGWGAEDMFKTNAERYNVKSSYDSNLSAYTTTLEVDDSAEGRAKAARAAKLAAEIETTDTYRKQIALENQDEGEAISAVIKEAPPAAGRYIPPHRRKPGSQPLTQGAANKPVAINGAPATAESTDVSASQAMSGASGRLPEVNESESEVDKNKKNAMLNSKTDGSKQAASAPVTSQQSVPSSPTVPAQSTNLTVTAASPGATKQDMALSNVNPHKPLQLSKSDHTRLEDHSRSQRPAKPEQKKSDRESSVDIKELRDFSDKFKIAPSVDGTKEKRLEKAQRQSSQNNETPAEDFAQQRPDATKEAPTTEETSEKKKSVLNPNAKEFTLNPNAREFKPTGVQAVQTATSPRPQTQSPVVQQAIPIPHHHIYPQAYMAAPMAPAMMAPQSDQQAIPAAKRAVVSVVRSDLGAAQAQAQALAATGTPLQAQPAAGMPGTHQYPGFTQQFVVGTPQNMPHAYAHGQGPVYGQQVVPISNNGPRLVNPQMGAQMTQMAQYHHPHHQQMGQIANVPQQHVFIQGPGGMSQPQPPPQLMPPNQPQTHPHHPSHYVPHHSRSTPPQQTSHQQQPNQPPQGQAQHPPQQISYHHNGQMPPGGQPPLQPSPHTPASPQAQPPGIPMSYNFSQPPIPTHTQNPPMHQMAANIMQFTPQVTYTAHHAHGQPPQNQVMMLQQPPQHIQGQPHHIQHGPIQMGHSQMQGPMHMSQSGHPMGGPQMGPVSMPANIHYAPQPSPR